MPSWKVTSACVSGLPEPSTSRAFLMTVFLFSLTEFIVVLLRKWESPGVAAIALADYFTRAFLPTFANSVVESVRKQNRGLYCSFRWRYSVGRGGGPSKKPDGIPHSFCLYDGMPLWGRKEDGIPCVEKVSVPVSTGGMPSYGFAIANLAGCRHVFLYVSPRAQTEYRHFTSNSRTQLTFAGQNLNHIRVKQSIR